MRIRDVLFPPACLLCDRPFVPPSSGAGSSPGADRLCRACLDALVAPAHQNRCRVCSIPLPRLITVCERCRRETYSFERAFALHRYTGVPARLVQVYKFGRHPSLGRVIGGLMAPTAESLAGSAPVVVPAPSRRRTVRERGFAGARLIAREIGRRTGFRVADLLVARRGRSQKTLTYAARRANASSTIAIRRGSVSPAEVLLVDDIFTTGTTAERCTAELTRAGAERVVVLAFALEY